jgi:hypothetical protein
MLYLCWCDGDAQTRPPYASMHQDLLYQALDSINGNGKADATK